MNECSSFRKEVCAAGQRRCPFVWHPPRGGPPEAMVRAKKWCQQVPTLRLLLLVVLGGHADSTGCLGARKCQGLGSSRRSV